MQERKWYQRLCGRLCFDCAPVERDVKGTSQVTFCHEERDGEAVLAIAGEIDGFVASAFSGELHSLIRRAHSPALIDLTGVTYIDASALRALLGARSDALAVGVNLVLFAPSGFVRRVLDITGVGDDFEIREFAETSGKHG